MSNNRVLTTTQDKLLPKLVDTVLDSNVFATRMISKAKKFKGEQLKKTIKVSKNTTGGSFSGYDILSTEATDNRQKLAFDPKFYSISVSIPLTDLAVNDVKETQVIDLMSAEMESASQDMADDIGSLFYGDGTGNGGKDFSGLGAIVDDGSDIATYGGLSRATYSTIQATVTASGGALTLAKMAALYNNVTSGTQKPTIGVCDQNVWSLYESLIEPRMRINQNVPTGAGIKGSAGFTGLEYKGFNLVADEKAVAGDLYFLNENYLDFYALPVPMTDKVKYKTVTEGNDYGQELGLGFSFSGWKESTNQAAILGQVFLGGELVSFNPKRQGKLTGITTA